LCHARTTEITDSLVELLIQLVQKIDTRAEKRVEKELTGDLKRVAGKTGILFRVAEAAVARPDETVRQVIYPVAGEVTLRDLAKEAKSEKATFTSKVRTVLRGSYSHHYRRLLPDLLAALEFRCDNTTHRPVMDACRYYTYLVATRCTTTTAWRPRTKSDPTHTKRPNTPAHQPDSPRSGLVGRLSYARFQGPAARNLRLPAPVDTLQQ
jgi:hypothetical protein